MKLLIKFLQQFCDFVQKYCTQIGCTLFVLYCLWPSRFASHYDYIAPDQIFDTLLQKTTKNMTLSQQMECDYSDIIADNTFMYKQTYQNEIFDSSEIKLGGVYYPGMYRWDDEILFVGRGGSQMTLRLRGRGGVHAKRDEPDRGVIVGSLCGTDERRWGLKKF